MFTPKLAGNTPRLNVTSRMVNIFSEKAIIAKPLDSKLSNDEKQEVRNGDMEKYITKAS